jgi:hypothetical protein
MVPEKDVNAVLLEASHEALGSADHRTVFPCMCRHTKDRHGWHGRHESEQQCPAQYPERCIVRTNAFIDVFHLFSPKKIAAYKASIFLSPMLVCHRKPATRSRQRANSLLQG